jgi:hypothetical protein
MRRGGVRELEPIRRQQKSASPFQYIPFTADSVGTTQVRRYEVQMVFNGRWKVYLIIFNSRHTQIGYVVSQIWCGVAKKGCGVAQIVMCRPSKRQASVRFPSCHPFLSVSGEELRMGLGD